MADENKPVTIKEKLVCLALSVIVFIWSCYQMYEDDLYHLWLNSPIEFRLKSGIIFLCIFSFIAIIYFLKKILFLSKEDKPNHPLEP